MTVHDPIRQIRYLRQTLSQDKKPLGFFLAAGCPLAVDMAMGEKPLIPDVNGLTKLVKDELLADAEVKLLYKKLGDELDKMANPGANIEEILSFVRGMKQVSKGATEIRGFKEDDLKILEQKICKKISDKLKVNLPNNKTPYHHMVKWIHNIQRESPIEIFTTNYDLLTEEALEKIGVPYFDGFVGSKQPFFDLRAVEDNLIPKHWSRLWKIHGSINWFYRENEQVFRSTSIGGDNVCLIYPSHLKYDQSRKMPYLALIDRLNSFIRQNSSVLIISGYSFGDDHINDTIINALKANPTGMVIGLLYDTLGYKEEGSEEFKIRYEKALQLSENRSNLSIWTYDEAVIGGLRGIWRPPKQEEASEHIGAALKYFPKEEIDGLDGTKITIPDRYELHLGNFAVLGQFLHELIGQEQFKTHDAK